jgi:hypothetical protein
VNRPALLSPAAQDSPAEAARTVLRDRFNALQAALEANISE